jgi:AraC-like DNA-binding protein
MPGSAVHVFLYPEEYEAGFPELNMTLTLSGPGDFRARLTRVECRSLRLTRCQETVPRIAHLSIDTATTCMMFRVSEGPPARLGGTSLAFGDVAVLGTGYRCHSMTTGRFEWGLITFRPGRLSAKARTVIGKAVVGPNLVSAFTPERRHLRRLLRLHRRASEVARSRPEILNTESAGAELEDALIDALAACLANGASDNSGRGQQQRSEIMNRMEDILPTSAGKRIRSTELKELLGVPVRLLSTSCREQLGMSLDRYLRLRQMKRARRELQRSEPMPRLVSVIAAQCGFHEPGRFAVQYRELFGESPSETQRRMVAAEAS